jgi:ABC-type branched-subunit amino acid transport system permease subunit
MTMLVWSLLVIAGVGATAHLYRHMGAAVASQASIMSVAALADALLLKQQINPTLSWIVAVGFGCGLGLLHLPILLKTGTSLLLVITVMGQFVMVELWSALPGLTGGSGPLLLPGDISARAAIWLLCLLIISALAYLHFSSGSRARKRFDWACVQEMNLKAGAFGVPALRLYVLGFAIYGAMLGAAGVAGARYLGSLSVSTFGLPLALVMLTIVLSGAGRPIFLLWLLSLLYCFIRVFLLRSVYASGNAAIVLEVSFPLLLLLLLLRTRKKSLHTARLQETPPSSPE